MKKRTVMDILEEFMGDDTEEIFDKELRSLHIKSIIDAPIDIKHKFVQNVVTKYLDFSSEKTAGIYHDLLDALGIAPRVVLLDEYFKKDKGIHDVILEAMDEFWDEVYGYVIDYEVVLNLYWKKGAEAVMGRVEYAKVVKVTGDALEFSKQKLEQAYRHLLNKLKLATPQMKNVHKELFSLLNEAVRENIETDSPSKALLYQHINGFWNRVTNMVKELEKLFAVSLNEEIKNLRANDEDKSLIEALQMEVKDHWQRLSNHYEALKLDIKNDNYDDLEL